MKVKIAVAQIKIDLSNVEKTLSKVDKYVKKASKKADIIVFPEYTISWNFMDEERKYLKYFQDLAKKYRLDIVAGSMTTVYRKKKYNTTYYIDSKGKVKGTYRKVNLWHPERYWLSQGNEVCVFNTKFGKIGLVICWDLAFPEIYRAMVKKGVSIVFCPSYWSYQDASRIGLKYNKLSEEIFVDGCCLSRAIENEIIHVFCNYAGTSKEAKKTYSSCGHSQITVPFKGSIKKLSNNKESMFIQEVDTKILKDAEKAYKIRKDLKKGI